MTAPHGEPETRYVQAYSLRASAPVTHAAPDDSNKHNATSICGRTELTVIELEISGHFSPFDPSSAYSCKLCVKKLAAPTPTEGEVETEPEVVWLLEAKTHGGARTHYMMPDIPEGERWTSDVHKAQRFTSEAEAKERKDPHDYRARAVEHVFGLTLPAPSVAGDAERDAYAAALAKALEDFSGGEHGVVVAMVGTNAVVIVKPSREQEHWTREAALEDANEVICTVLTSAGDAETEDETVILLKLNRCVKRLIEFTETSAPEAFMARDWALLDRLSREIARLRSTPEAARDV